MCVIMEDLLESKNRESMETAYSMQSMTYLYKEGIWSRQGGSKPVVVRCSYEPMVRSCNRELLDSQQQEERGHGS
jgi:hypothetical protein